jgi:Domain of unknown function (DUF4105)
MPRLRSCHRRGALSTPDCEARSWSGVVRGKSRINFRRLAGWLGLAVLSIVVFITGVWCSLAVWFRCAVGEPGRSALAGAILVLTAVTMGFLATSRRWLVLTVYAAVFALVLVWWLTVLPSNDRDWQPDVARNVTATIDGDRLLVDNVRNFTWRSDADFDQRWEQRTYNLSQVHDVDLVLSYWAGEAIAHLIVSFGFEDGQRLDFSIETRKERGEDYSTIAGFFKQYELVIIAADERDIVRVRSNVRGEDVRIYRLRMPPAYAQRLLRAYVEDANELAREPRWYNTATGNCTTLVFGMVTTIRPGLPLDYRILLSGYLPDYAYDIGALDTSSAFKKLRALSRIHDKALLADTDPNFSAKIREGIPTPDQGH